MGATTKRCSCTVLEVRHDSKKVINVTAHVRANSWDFFVSGVKPGLFPSPGLISEEGT